MATWPETPERLFAQKRQQICFAAFAQWTQPTFLLC